MQFYKKINIDSNSKIFELILEKPQLLLLLEHFNFNFKVQDKTISDLCALHKISETVFITFIKLYFNNQPVDSENYTEKDIETILFYLKRCHKYYKEDKYPEIISFIKQLQASDNSIEIKLIEKFFNEYFEEVNEHLTYEEDIVFPYLSSLLNKSNSKQNLKYSVAAYKNHHSDIEYKLNELKNILLKVVSIENQQDTVRKLLFSLFELEQDLHIHSLIEEVILTPLGKQLESKVNND